MSAVLGIGLTALFIAFLYAVYSAFKISQRSRKKKKQDLATKMYLERHPELKEKGQEES